MFSISRRVFSVFNLTKLSCFQHPQFSRRISLIATVNLAPPNSTKHYCSTILVSKMSQKSITSFFTRKAPVSTTAVTESSDGDGENIVKPVKPTSEEKKKVQNSPLREPNQIKEAIKDEPESSLDSPIKKTKKARKRIESSSDEENGSPKKESPEKTKTTAKKRKSSPSLSESKVSKKTKDEKEETEIKSEKEETEITKSTEETETAKSDSSGEKKKQRRSQQEKDALPKKKASKAVKIEEPENVTEPMEVENEDAETPKVKVTSKKTKKGKKSES